MSGADDQPPVVSGAGGPPPAVVRVLVADDQRLVRDGIASLLALQVGLEVVGCAADGDEAVELATRLVPDVVLMDVRMPGRDGVTATAELRAVLPQARVLMLTTFDDEEYVLAALAAGACGYLLKDLPAPELARAVRLAADGVDQYDPAATRRLVGALGRFGAAGAQAPQAPQVPEVPAAPEVPEGLTSRELDVVRLLATGATNRQIARRLYLSEGTVKNHVSSILARVGLRDRTQLALHAHEHGWL